MIDRIIIVEISLTRCCEQNNILYLNSTYVFFFNVIFNKYLKCIFILL